jgi:hypothetical protein
LRAAAFGVDLFLVAEYMWLLRFVDKDLSPKTPEMLYSCL